MTIPFIVVIPARFSSTRLPGKPLLDIAGLPMIQHVWQQARKSFAEQVYIATDDERIVDVCESFGACVVKTRSDHCSGTDRLAEVVSLLNLPQDTIIVNVQGDEPLIPPCIINQVAKNLAYNAQAGMATLAEPITEVSAFLNPNVVKVVTDGNGYALTFSRAPLPWPRDAFSVNQTILPCEFSFRRHIGIYSYRANFLKQFVQWDSCWLERCESLEQLRALFNGTKIHVDDALEAPLAGVDTLDDLERVRQLLTH